tara:strand:+ start:100 stop:303 length:204 start_codon:yes stop_codon:yes gene_type:complete
MQNLTNDQSLRADLLITFISKTVSSETQDLLIKEYGFDNFMTVMKARKKEADFQNCVESMKDLYPAF